MEEERPHTNGSGFDGASGDGAKIGGILERARAERGLSLGEVEQATKIRKRYLAGLEQEDYSSLPDSVYVQGFLKTYANFLGLDGEELSRELKRRRGRRRDKRQPGVGEIRKTGFDRPVLGPGGVSGAQGRRVSSATLLTLLISVVALGAVVGALYYVGRDTQTLGPPQPSPPAEQAPAAVEENPGGGADEAAEGEGRSGAGDENEGGAQAGSGEVAGGGGATGAPPESLEVTVSVEGAESWVSISSDGSVAYSQIAQPGFSQTFEARDSIVLSTGNAGAVNVEVNGQDVGALGGSGQVIDRSFTLKDAG